MGRQLKNDRKISSDRVGKIRKQKSKILIAVEGNNKTEKTYFKNFETIKTPFNITYASGNNTDPLKLVKMLIKEIEKMELDFVNDAAYCIFDTDTSIYKNHIIREAIELAEKNNIRVITSTPCFELWFLLHYNYTTSNMSNEEVIKKLKKYYPKYEKNVNIYPDIIENVYLAINRAKKIRIISKRKWKYNRGCRI